MWVRDANRDASDRVRWTELGRQFRGDARHLADVSGLLVSVRAECRARTMLYVPPRRKGAPAVVVVPAVAEPDAVNRMVAVALGIHLEGPRRYTVYADGPPAQLHARHRRANVFASAFLRGGTTVEADADRLGRRAG